MKTFFKHGLTAIQKIELELSLILILLSVGSILIHRSEGIGYFNSFYFSVITLAGIGYGDIVPHTIVGKIIAMIYGLIGVPLFVVAGLLIIELLKGSGKE